MEAIDHLDLVVSSLERSVPFYRGLLMPLGYVHAGELAGERGERVIYLSRHADSGRLGLREAPEPQPGGDRPYDRYAAGIHHVAFAADRRELVDEAAVWAHKHGVEIESGPCEYGYTPGYYATFIHDPDGLKLEIVHRPGEAELAHRMRLLEQTVRELRLRAAGGLRENRSGG